MSNYIPQKPWISLLIHAQISCQETIFVDNIESQSSSNMYDYSCVVTAAVEEDQNPQTSSCTFFQWKWLITKYHGPKEIDTQYAVWKIRKFFYRSVIKLFLSFTVIWDVHSSFIRNKTTFSKYCVTQRIWKPFGSLSTRRSQSSQILGMANCPNF